MKYRYDTDTVHRMDGIEAILKRRGLEGWRLRQVVSSTQGHLIIWEKEVETE